MPKMQMKRINYANGSIFYDNAVVDVDQNRYDYAVGMGDAIASVADVTTPPDVPERVDNRP